MLPARRAPVVAGLLAAVVATSVVHGMANPEAWIGQSYVRAFDGAAPGAFSREKGVRGPAFDPAHLHLSRLPAASVSGPRIVVGDRLTLGQPGGAVVSYEVIEVKPLALSPDGASVDSPRLQMVTAIASGELPVRTIRFLIEADEAAVAPPSAKPHAL